MKEKLTKNLGIKLISLFCAFFLWLAIVNVANPIKVSTREVPVTILNESVLERANLTYEIEGKETATVSFRVRTRDDYRIKATDFYAYADLTEMYDVTGAIPIRVEVVNNNQLLESVPTVRSPEVIRIKTEELQTKEFEVKAFTAGTPADGYERGTVTVVPSTVSVKGPTSLIGQISAVGIQFNIEGAESDVSGTATPIYFDANGNELTDLGASVQTLGGDVSYTMSILKVKEVPLDFVVTGEVAQGYRYTGPQTEASAIQVAGLKSDLASVSTITVQDPSLSISGATEDRVCQIDLRDFVDSSLTIVSPEDPVIDVTLQVEPLTERTFTADTSAIVLEGTNENYEYTPEEEEIEIRIRGLKEDLDSLSVDKMNLRASVSGLQPGEHTVTAQLQLDDAFELMEVPSFTVTVTEGADRSQEASATESADTAEETAAGAARGTDAAQAGAGD